jgi:hypothetical protein
MVWGPVADMPSAYLRFSLDLLLSLLLLCSFLCFLHGQIDTRVCHNCIHGYAWVVLLSGANSKSKLLHGRAQ